MISRRGYSWNPKYDGFETVYSAIENELGKCAVEVIKTCGGWVKFCKEWGKEEGDTSSRAQLRNICESCIRKDKSIEESKRIKSGKTSNILGK